MIRISLLGLFLLCNCVHLQASFASTAQKEQAEKPSLRAQRAAMMKDRSKNIFAVAAKVAQAAKSDQEKLFDKNALKAMNIEISEEEAQDLKLPKKTVVFNLIGKTVGGSVYQSGQSVVDIKKMDRLKYANKNSFNRGQFVVVFQEDRCYYGLIVCKNADDSYQVQVSDSQAAKVGTGDIASK